ncbi:chaoptin-like [Ceratina calcarata]|nr:chaoptin-like [Ceratina calcarata]
MKGRFPNKLFNVTLTGRALKDISPDILRGIRNPHLHFGMYNTSVSTVPKDVFDNAEWVRNVTVHLHHSDVRTLNNPSNGYKPGVPGKRFLLKLTVAGNYFTCDCDIGWMEDWQRKHRQYQEDRCTTYSEFKNFERDEEDDEFDCWDNGWDDDLRESFCLNKNNMSVLEALKTDLECGWGAADSVQAPHRSLLFFFFFFFVTVIY